MSTRRSGGLKGAVQINGNRQTFIADLFDHHQARLAARPLALGREPWFRCFITDNKTEAKRILTRNEVRPLTVTGVTVTRHWPDP